MEAGTIKEVLDLYGSGSEQHVNFEKSSISFSRNVKREQKDEVFSALSVKEVSNHVDYLGLPSIIGQSKRDVFFYLKDKV